MLLKFSILLTIILILILTNNYVSGQIHRATNQNSYQIKYNTNFTLQYYLKRLTDQYSSNSIINSTYFNGFQLYEPKLTIWLTSVIGTFFVGVCGIVPVIILPQLAEDHHKLVKSVLFKCLTSFAAGTLLGDVFVHLLPETYTQKVLENDKLVMSNGLWILFGLLSFLTIEKVFPDTDDDNESNKIDKKEEPKIQTVQKQTKPKKSKKNKKKKETIDYKPLENFTVSTSLETSKSKTKFKFLNSIKIVGILNLIANIIDNFTHGIAVAGSFQASFKFGVMTLLATMLHEIPHEIGDFVILLKSGLNYKDAALAQLTTAFSGIIGAIFALALSSAEKAGDFTCWILPFTSGGFLYISLVNIMPEILCEKNLKTSIKQIMSLFFGVFIIYIFNFIFE